MVATPALGRLHGPARGRAALLDLLMPELRGLEVLKIIRFRPALAALPVVVVTAMDDEATTRSGFEFGATNYLTKPFSIPQLAARVRACLARNVVEVT